MTSTPKKLDLNTPEGEFSASTVVMNTIEQVTAALLSDEMFSTYVSETPDNDVISISRDGLTHIILGPALWSSFERRLPYLENANQPGISLVCAGTDVDFANFPPEMRRPDVQQMGLPVSRLNLIAILQSIHNLQTLISHSNAAAREVQEANQNVKYVMSISRELNGERNIPKLLNLILSKARDICSADAGSIYTVESATSNVRDGTIHFRLLRMIPLYKIFLNFRCR